MGEIYSHAARVVAWLGADNAKLDTFFWFHRVVWPAFFNYACCPGPERLKPEDREGLKGRAIPRRPCPQRFNMPLQSIADTLRFIIHLSHLENSLIVQPREPVKHPSSEIGTQRVKVSGLHGAGNLGHEVNLTARSRRRNFDHLSTSPTPLAPLVRGAA
jgi:hypothetical protein